MFESKVEDFMSSIIDSDQDSKLEAELNTSIIVTSQTKKTLPELERDG